jgi:hypothetical protein
MDWTCATTLVLCAIGLAVAGWAHVRTLQSQVSLAEHRAASIQRVGAPAVTYVATRAAAAR